MYSLKSLVVAETVLLRRDQNSWKKKEKQNLKTCSCQAEKSLNSNDSINFSLFFFFSVAYVSAANRKKTFHFYLKVVHEKCITSAVQCSAVIKEGRAVGTSCVTCRHLSRAALHRPRSTMKWFTPVQFTCPRHTWWNHLKYYEVCPCPCPCPSELNSRKRKREKTNSNSNSNGILNREMRATEENVLFTFIQGSRKQQLDVVCCHILTRLASFFFNSIYEGEDERWPRPTAFDNLNSYR